MSPPPVMPGAALGAAPGKLILFGEHAVLYGQPAFGVALGRGVRVRIERGTGRVSATVAGAAAQVAGARDAARPEMIVAAALGEACGGLDVSIDVEIPPAAGLGSSAALAVALLRARRVIDGTNPSRREMLEAAIAIEDVAHGQSSGLDPAICLSGGIIGFRRKNGRVQVKRLRPAASFHLVVGAKGSHGGTGARVAGVAELAARAPATMKAAMKTLGAAARAGMRALAGGDVALAGQAMDLAHGVLSGLGLVGDEIEQLVRAARELGAAGAKMSGAGGEGGAFYALAPDIRTAQIIRDHLASHGAESWIETAS